MIKEAIKYLQSYSSSPNKVNRLIVSNFLTTNKKESITNSFIKSFLITNESQDWEELQTFVKIQKLATIEDLVKVFEFVISPEEKVVTGAIYTPEQIRNYIVDQVMRQFSNTESITVCDPACGCSGFLFSASKKIKQQTGKPLSKIYAENIFGLDIQSYSVERSKILLALSAIIDGEDEELFQFNLFEGNALSFDWNAHIKDFGGFHSILGNPPYVCSRNIDDESKRLLKNWEVCSSGHPDLYIPFFQIGLENLKSEGILSFITMNTFFKSVNGRALRSYFQNNSFDIRITDFGSSQIFLSKSTYTCIVSIIKQESENLQYRKINESDLDKNLKYISINFNHLNAHSGWNMYNPEIIAKIEGTGTPFGDLYRTSNGIATLKNDLYFFQPVKEDANNYYLQNGSIYPIEKTACKDIINPNKFTKTDNIDTLKKKAIFPYHFSENGIELIPEADFIQNFPLTYNYLNEKRALLASRDKGNGQYVNWYAYGRNQALERFKYKLFFPHIAPSIPNYVLSADQDLLFHNGLAIISDNREDLLFLRKLMSTKLFWFYIQSTSKPYGSGYFSLSRNYLKGFGIYNFSAEERQFLIAENDNQAINAFVEERYQIEPSLLH